MKQLCIFLVLISTVAFSQKNNKTRDIIYLKNGEIISSRIIRVANRNIYYYNPKTFQITKILLDKVDNYEYNDEFFKTNSLGKMEHKEVVFMLGYNKDEIYRAIKDWFIINSRKYFDGVYLEDPEHFILYGIIHTQGYLKFDLLTFMSAIDDNSEEIRTYYLKYDVRIRIKDNRFKIQITNLEIDNNQDLYVKSLKDIYDKRKTKMGEITESGLEIKKLKDFINTQIGEIEYHCELIKLNDTYHNNVIRLMLADDDW